MSKYVSKHYTAEEIDQRLLQGYYDDVVAAGYTGSFEQFKKSLVLSGCILNCGTVELSSTIENGVAVDKAGDPNILFYVYKTSNGQVGIIKQIYKRNGNTIQYLTLDGVEYVRTVNYSSGRTGSWKNIDKASLVYRLHYDPSSRTVSFWDPIQDTAFGGVQLPLASQSTAGLMSSNDKTKLDKLSSGGGDIIGTSYDLNTYDNAGVYLIQTGSNSAQNYPIQTPKNSVIKLIVTDSYDGDYHVVLQVAIVNNHVGGEGNMYLRTRTRDQWGSWAKLQTNVEVNAIGLGQSKTFDDLTDNGMYSGVNVYHTGSTDSNGYPIVGYETFVLVVISGYLTGAGVTQLKYSINTDGNTKVETRNNVNGWTNWSPIQGGGTSTISEATTETAGVVKLGKSNNEGWLAIGNSNDSSIGSGLGLKIDSSVFGILYNTLLLRLGNGGGLKQDGGLRINLGTEIKGYNQNAIPLCMGTPVNIDEFNQFTGNKKLNEVPLIPVHPDQFKLGNNGLELKNPGSATKVTWDSSSDMNRFQTPGVYDIYGERTNSNDNLPILNASPGHSISARLTVVASTLQPDQTEICITQFLMLSNRLGGEGTMYVRTYNQNNSPFTDGWSPWQKQMGMVETIINSNDITAGQEIFSGYAVSIGKGLNGMIDNGMYSGIYTDGIEYTGEWDNNSGKPLYVINPAAISYLETFVLVVINDYAASSKLNLPRHITQLKYAVDAITGQSTVKKRVGTGKDTISWGDWQDIGGGGSNEVDVTDAVKAYGLPALIEQGFAQEGVTYKVLDFGENAPVVFDSENKIFNKLISSGIDGIEGHWDAYIKNYNNYITIHACGYEGGNNPRVLLYQFILSKDLKTIKVSADMTTL